jgi:CspA family cold shock protein
MVRGRVKWYSADLGYGFILPEDGGVEVLVREEDITGDGSRSLEEDAEVTYEVVQGREGPEAKKVSEG